MGLFGLIFAVGCSIGGIVFLILYFLLPLMYRSQASLIPMNKQLKQIYDTKLKQTRVIMKVGALFLFILAGAGFLLFLMHPQDAQFLFQGHK